jgi:hypothetical protein
MPKHAVAVPHAMWRLQECWLMSPRAPPALTSSRPQRWLPLLLKAQSVVLRLTLGLLLVATTTNLCKGGWVGGCMGGWAGGQANHQAITKAHLTMPQG